MTSIIENNLLLAKFMGGKLRDEVLPEIADKMWCNQIWVPKFGICRYDTAVVGSGKTLSYHADWNWLMSVVDKCHKTNKCEIDIRSVGVVDLCYNKTCVHFYSSDLITNTYEACVEFVKWYNRESKIHKL